MDGIDEILRAEKEAERIRREGAEAADAILGAAEGYRADALEAARRAGDAEALRLRKQAEEQAAERRGERGVLADVKEAELTKLARSRMDAVAEWLASRIKEV